MRIKTIYDLKLIGYSIFVITIFNFLFFFFWDNTRIIIRTILESRFISSFIWTVTIVIFILHYIRHKEKEVKSETIITKKFGEFMDNALGGIAYSTIISTSITLLKGLYIQKFFTDKIYFKEFNNLDLTTVFGVVLFLLYYAGLKVVDIAKETYKVKRTEIVMTENKIAVIPNENQER